MSLNSYKIFYRGATLVLNLWHYFYKRNEFILLKQTTESSLRTSSFSLFLRDAEDSLRDRNFRPWESSLQLLSIGFHLPLVFTELFLLRMRILRNTVDASIDVHGQRSGFHSESGLNLYEYGSEFVFRGTAQVLRRCLARDIIKHIGADNSNKRLLDAGAGPGDLISFLVQQCPELPIDAWDLSPACLKRLKLKFGNRVNAVRCDLRRISTPEPVYNAISLCFMLHEFAPDDRRRILLNLRSCLSSSGKLWIMDPLQAESPSPLLNAVKFFGRNYHEPHFTSYLEDKLESLCDETGFVVEDVREIHLAKILRIRIKDQT
jgi:ubiquinone/menaquinone biosynthesis C-methylase UbiE